MIEWIQAHIAEMGTVVGFLYLAARIIVAWTKTPKDDEVVGIVWKIVSMIGKAFGLDLNQGRKSTGDGSSTGAGTVALILIVLLVSGCPALMNGKVLSPEADLLIAQHSFSGIVDGLTAMKLAGRFNEEDTKKITEIIHEGEELLLEWEVQVLEGANTVQASAKMFDRLIHKLVFYEMKGGGT